MAEKGIIMTTESVRAILGGRKTKTRRAMKPQPMQDELNLWNWKDCAWMSGGIGFPTSGIEDHAPWQVGDMLWVRETWLELDPIHHIDRQKYAFKANSYAEGEERRQEYRRAGYPYSWRSPRYMPKAAARIWLRVTGIRAEQLNEITEADAWAEGVAIPKNSVTRYEDEGRALYAELWDRINGKKQGQRWADNPWVWVIEFERVT